MFQVTHLHIRILGIMIFGCLVSPLLLAESIGNLSKVEGTVFLHKGGGARYEKLDQAGSVIDATDMLRTASTSRATVKLNSGSQILLDHNSTATFRSLNETQTQEGVALFDIKKQGQVAGFKVTTPVATIGIRGTQFAVEVGGESAANIYMKRGAIEVSAINKEFKRYRENAAAEFADYKNAQQEALDEYKRQLKKEYYEFVTGFVMESDSAVSISGDEVRDTKRPDAVEQLMDEFFLAHTEEPHHIQ